MSKGAKNRGRTRRINVLSPALLHFESRQEAHYNAHLTEAEYIALKMRAQRKVERRQPFVTIRRFSWENTDD